MFLFDEVDFVQSQNLPLGRLLAFMPLGYLVTILIETPVLLFGLSPKLSVRQRLWCGVWLTACTYPIVVLVLPAVFLEHSRTLYLAVAETFAPVAECVLFWLVYRNRGLLDGRDWVRSFIAIVIANLASFGLGEVLNYFAWFGLV